MGKLKVELPDDASEDLRQLFEDYVERDIMKGNYAEALGLAASNGRTDLVKLLIDGGIDIHLNNDEAVRYASENGHLDTVKFLIENGANIHVNYDYPLRYAAENGYLDVVKLLYENHAQIVTAKQNAFIHALRSENKEIIDYFLSKQKNLEKFL